MKLQAINSTHIEQAARKIDVEGVPRNQVWSQYYVVVNNREYPFKHLVRTAFALVSQEEINFQSNESYRGYVEGLGYAFNYYKDGYNFFTEKELDLYVSVHKQDYRTGNLAQTAYGQKLNSINQKLKYWLEQIKPSDFKIRYDGKWLGANTKVSEYLWVTQDTF